MLQQHVELMRLRDTATHMYRQKLDMHMLTTKTIRRSPYFIRKRTRDN